MKRTVFFLSVLLTVISCSENMKNNFTTNKDDTFKTKSVNVYPNLAMIDTAALVKYLNNTPLTVHERDSIAKILASDALIKNTKSDNIIYGESSEYNDYSGKIHLKVFYAYITVLQHHPLVDVWVSQNYAMVGGGAQAYGYTGNGAFLTQSSPLNDTTWQGQSKDHIVQDQHYLEVYAIGMRIDSVSTSYLRSKIHIFLNVSSSNHFPTAQAVVPDNYILFGGGAWDQYNGYGNMLTGSYPIGNAAWVGSGKDYRRSDQCQITVYAIGIENISYPNVGYLQLTYRENQELSYSGQESFCYAQVWDGYALTCPGGYCTYQSTGRMLVKLYPQDMPPGAQMSSKDTPGYPDHGYNYAFGYGIEQRPF